MKFFHLFIVRLLEVGGVDLETLVAICTSGPGIGTLTAQRVFFKFIGYRCGVVKLIGAGAAYTLTHYTSNILHKASQYRVGRIVL